MAGKTVIIDDIDETAPPEPIIPLAPEVEELWSSRALLLVLLLLILSFWVSYYLKVRKIRSVHETIVALLAGCFVGLVVRLAPGTVVQGMISFKNTILLNVLLPPIILNSGFELRQANFFRNFGVILAFAFAGTFISAIVVGVLVYIWALLGLEGLSLTIVECLIFGSTLSATDPVTILAIFNAMKVDPKLYSIIFGESILNDAVAIVMFETLSQFHGEKIHILSFFHGVGIFLLIFMVSMALGVVFGLGCSLMLKHSRLNEYPEIESCLIILIAYTSYFFSNGLTMSGIVSLLFCGITLKHYAYHNMSRRAQRTSKYMFASLAQLSENFIFIYLGLSLFTQTDLVYKPMFIIVTALAVVAARWCAVFPISKLINIGFRARGQRAEELPQSYQMMLFWAGLRGAVGVALAAGIKGHNAKSLRTTVLVTVVITLIVFGGTVGRMVDIVGIRTGVQEDDGESSDDDAQPNAAGIYTSGRASVSSSYLDSHTALHGAQAKRQGNGHYNGPPEPDSEDDDPEVLPSANSTTSFSEGLDSGAVWRDGQWFNVLDEQYLLPVFSNATASRRQASRKAMRSSARVNDSTSPLEQDGGPELDLGTRRRELDRQNSDERTSGNGTRSRGLVGHKPTPSLSSAISSLFSYSSGSSERGWQTTTASSAGDRLAVPLNDFGMRSDKTPRGLRGTDQSSGKRKDPSLRRHRLSAAYPIGSGSDSDVMPPGDVRGAHHAGSPDLSIDGMPLSGTSAVTTAMVSRERAASSMGFNREGTPEDALTTPRQNLQHRYARSDVTEALLRRQSTPFNADSSQRPGTAGASPRGSIPSESGASNTTSRKPRRSSLVNGQK